MTSPNGDDLAAAVARVELLGAELMAALLAERSALRDRASAAITQAAAVKQGLFDRLAEVTRRLGEFAAASDGASGGERRIASRDRLRSHIEAAGLLPQWQQAADRLSHCMLLNQHNGMLVAGHLSLQRNLLDILCGRESNASVYSAFGRIEHAQGGAALARI